MRIAAALLVSSALLASIPALADGLEAATVQISALLASKEKREFDPRLAPLRSQLRGLPFKGYTLLGVQSCRMNLGDQCGMDIPGGAYLHVTTTEATPRHLKMRVLLNQQNRPILNADLKLSRNSGILLKSARSEMGTIILSIRAAAPDEPPATAQRRGR